MSRTQHRNKNLNVAAAAANDEFYTRLNDVAAEVVRYKKHFKNKVVYCNCDDPRVSAFFKYFTQSFEDLALKKVIASCYKNDNIDLFSSHDKEKAVYIEYAGRWQENYNHDDIEVKSLQGDGDFRNPESIELLKKSDIVITNPPFSLFREYIAQLVEHGKKFLILGNMNALTYRDVFPLIRDNKVWVGNKPMGTDMLFRVTPEYAKILVQTKKEGSAYKIVEGEVLGRTSVIWYTNLDFPKRHENLILINKYKGNEKDYPKYDNYDAIEVSKVDNIPMDYAGVMGVPITFLDKYSPEQFEIIGMAEDNGRGYSGGVWEGGDIKCRINGKAKFKRLFIRNKKPRT